VLSVTAIEPSKSKLCKILEDNMPMASIVPIGRKYFNDAMGMYVVLYINKYWLNELNCFFFIT
jgi:hypothetical protein